MNEYLDVGGEMSATCRRPHINQPDSTNQEKSGPPREAPRNGSRENGVHGHAASCEIAAARSVGSPVYGDGAGLIDILRFAWAV